MCQCIVLCWNVYKRSSFFLTLNYCGSDNRFDMPSTVNNGQCLEVACMKYMTTRNAETGEAIASVRHQCHIILIHSEGTIYIVSYSCLQLLWLTVCNAKAEMRFSYGHMSGSIVQLVLNFLSNDWWAVATEHTAVIFAKVAIKVPSLPWDEANTDFSVQWKCSSRLLVWLSNVSTPWRPYPA